MTASPENTFGVEKTTNKMETKRGQTLNCIYSAVYQVDEALNRSSIKQYFWTVLIRPKLPIFLVILACLIAICLISFPYQEWIALVLGTLVLVLIVSWMKAYFVTQAQGRDGLKLLNHPNIEIEMDEETITYRSSTGTRLHSWSKIDKLIETRDFVILQSGKLPLLILPKLPLSTDALKYLKGKTQSQI